IMLVEDLIRQRAVRPPERMNSPLENRKVRLRGLGGTELCGVPNGCPSAAGDYRIWCAKGINRGCNITKPACAGSAARARATFHAPARPHPHLDSIRLIRKDGSKEAVFDDIVSKQAPRKYLADG